MIIIFWINCVLAIRLYHPCHIMRKSRNYYILCGCHRKCHYAISFHSIPFSIHTKCSEASERGSEHEQQQQRAVWIKYQIHVACIAINFNGENFERNSWLTETRQDGIYVFPVPIPLLTGFISLWRRQTDHPDNCRMQLKIYVYTQYK